MDKRTNRLRRAKRTRMKIKELNVPMLTVHRSSRHIAAQVIGVDGVVVSSASTMQESIKSSCKVTSNCDAAVTVGNQVAKVALEKGITRIAFDRSGFRYHGRVKALADAARETGLVF